MLLKDLNNLFKESLPLYTWCCFSTSLNDDIVEIEKSSGEISSLTFVVDDFSRLFLLYYFSLIFLIKDSRDQHKQKTVFYQIDDIN